MKNAQNWNLKRWRNSNLCIESVMKVYMQKEMLNSQHLRLKWNNSKIQKYKKPNPECKIAKNNWRSRKQRNFRSLKGLSVMTDQVEVALWLENHTVIWIKQIHYKEVQKKKRADRLCWDVQLPLVSWERREDSLMNKVIDWVVRLHQLKMRVKRFSHSDLRTVKMKETSGRNLKAINFL